MPASATNVVSLSSRKASEPQVSRCRLCNCALSPDIGDDPVHRLCGSCKSHPKAAKFLKDAGPAPRDFTTADRSLISSLGTTIPPRQLLDVLNARMHADLGTNASDYTLDQLEKALGTRRKPQEIDRAGMRRLLIEAARIGLLDRITSEVIEDFGVIFSLTPGQLTHVRDAIKGAKRRSQKAE